MNIDLEIEGIADQAIVDAIGKRVRAVERQFDRAEDWRLRLVPSDERGDWDLGIHTEAGWHLTSFTTRAESLPDLVERTLRERLAE